MSENNTENLQPRGTALVEASQPLDHLFPTPIPPAETFNLVNNWYPHVFPNLYGLMNAHLFNQLLTASTTNMTNGQNMFYTQSNVLDIPKDPTVPVTPTTTPLSGHFVPPIAEPSPTKQQNRTKPFHRTPYQRTPATPARNRDASNFLLNYPHRSLNIYSNQPSQAVMRKQSRRPIERYEGPKDLIEKAVVEEISKEHQTLETQRIETQRIEAQIIETVEIPVDTRVINDILTKRKPEICHTEKIQKEVFIKQEIIEEPEPKKIFEDDDSIELIEMVVATDARSCKQKEISNIGNTPENIKIKKSPFWVRRDCALHPFYKCQSLDCKMVEFTLGEVCAILEIPCPLGSRNKVVNSAAAIACSIANMEDINICPQDLPEELRKSFRFINIPCLAKAWKITGNKCCHFAAMRTLHINSSLIYDGNMFFNLPNNDIEKALKMSLEDKLPAAEKKDLLIYPKKRMDKLAHFKSLHGEVFGYDNLESAITAAKNYLPYSTRFIILILPEFGEWLTTYVQAQALEHIAMDKNCQVLLLCPPIYGSYNVWKESIKLVQKTLNEAKVEWVRRFAHSRIKMFGFDESNVEDHLSRYFGCLGTNVSNYIGADGQLTSGMIRHYIHAVHRELYHQEFRTSIGYFVYQKMPEGLYFQVEEPSYYRPPDKKENEQTPQMSRNEKRRIERARKKLKENTKAALLQ